MRPDLSPSVGPVWCNYEASAFFFVTNPPVYAYNSYEEGADGQSLVHAMVDAKFNFLSLFSFFDTAARSTMFRESSEPIFHNNTGVLLPLGRRVRDFVDGVSSTAILDVFYLAKSPAYFAYRHSVDVDWASLHMETPFLLQAFSDQLSLLPYFGPYYGGHIHLSGWPRTSNSRFSRRVRRIPN